MRAFGIERREAGSISMSRLSLGSCVGLCLGGVGRGVKYRVCEGTHLISYGLFGAGVGVGRWGLCILKGKRDVYISITSLALVFFKEGITTVRVGEFGDGYHCAYVFQSRLYLGIGMCGYSRILFSL